MDRLETRELAYFVTVAEELHFGRAAERLGIAAPPLSRAIARLERRLGVRLFDRTSRRVSLTDAGRVFLADSRSALAAVDRAARRARRAGRSSPLTVAVRSGTAAGVLSELVEAFARAYPVELLFTTDQVGALRGGAADVALLCASNDLAGFVTTDVAEELPVALVPVSHPFAARPAVSIADLRREDAFRTECPQLPLDEIVDRVAVGQLLAVVGHGAVSRAGDAVVGVPVADCPPTRVVLARLAGEVGAEVKAFERTARDVAARRLAVAAIA